MQQKRSKFTLPIILAAVGTGIANGLFGAGGGILTVVVLKRLCALNSERAHSTALMVMLPLSIISVAVYMLRNMLIFQSALPVILGMLPGSFFGARLLGKLRPLWIDSLFCLLMLAAGIRLLL
ncbi:MAG TPA: sulfite exporter TauE/SafE family protein [Clostridia bacterium]|nr:sulfite exporter TauE/SafE family protein [Clostridia bacterium]